jgi:hypothetical protein
MEAYPVGAPVEVLSSSGSWRRCDVLEHRAPSSIKIHYDGFASKYDEWLDVGTDGERIRELAPEPEPEPGGPHEQWHWDATQCAPRAERVKMNSSGGLAWPLECVDKPGATPTQNLSDPYIDNFLSAQIANFGLKGLLMIITRTDNSNVVVYKVSAAATTSQSAVHSILCE